MNLKDIANFYKAITDESLAFIVVLSAIYCVLSGIILPEWFIVSVGMVLMFYFKKNNDGDK